MSFLFLGGEMGAFTPSDASAIETAAEYDSSFARTSIRTVGASCFNDSAEFTETADVWVHFDAAQGGATGSTSTKGTIVAFLDGSGTEVFRLLADYQFSTSTTWQLQYSLSGVWTNIGSPFTTTDISRQTFDIHFVTNTASGSANVYVSGSQRAASGTTDFSGISGIAQVREKGRSMVGNPKVYMSQIIVATESTVGMRLGTIVMTGQGTTHTFTTGGFALIDEPTYSDADLINSDTADQVELFTGTPVPSFTNYIIRAVGIYARAKKSGTGPAQMRLLLRSAGTTYDNGADLPLDFGYGAIGAIWETNPATSAAFLSSEMASLEYGAKSIT